MINDEEVANSSKKHIQFKCRVHKPHPISDLILDTLFQTKAAENHTLWRRTYPYGLYKGLPPPPSGAKNALQIMSLVAYASETKKPLVSKSYFVYNWRPPHFSNLPVVV